MKTMQEIRANDQTIEELQQHIIDRRTIGSQMVGQLYPSIIADEISELQEMISKYRRAICKHEYYTEKDFRQEEIERHNVLATLIINEHRLVCKRCNYESVQSS